MPFASLPGVVPLYGWPDEGWWIGRVVTEEAKESITGIRADGGIKVLKDPLFPVIGPDDRQLTAMTFFDLKRDDWYTLGRSTLSSDSRNGISIFTEMLDALEHWRILQRYWWPFVWDMLDLHGTIDPFHMHQFRAPVFLPDAIYERAATLGEELFDLSPEELRSKLEWVMGQKRLPDEKGFPQRFYNEVYSDRVLFALPVPDRRFPRLMFESRNKVRSWEMYLWDTRSGVYIGNFGARDPKSSSTLSKILALAATSINEPHILPLSQEPAWRESLGLDREGVILLEGWSRASEPYRLLETTSPLLWETPAFLRWVKTLEAP